ncbi:hypothetical protein [Rheinheimera sp.]|uniref:hypothetical protein n=1 Tax=Rheinheimera sp. TaxID=1869214 RepID=UPI0025FC6FBE|nr:hypothetical protein [Rheinheimera sp.]
MMSKRYIPILALLLSVPFWFLAALNYPGGTSWDTTTHGFSLASNYVSSLFQPLALNGMVNTARFFAFIAMLLYAAGVSVMFWVISSSYPKSAASKTVQIFGVGSMVYTFIAVTTPMHNLLVVIAAIFLAVACAGMLVLLHQDSKHKLLLFGIFNLLLLAVLSATTKGNLLVGIGPACEWILFLCGALWVMLVYFGATAPHASARRTRENPRAT